jgi:hypothetical protein
MWKRRRTWLLFVALIGVALAVYFEPSHCVRGWLWGEAFFDGRPTSFWAAEIQQWECTGRCGEAGWTDTYSRRRYWPWWADRFLPKPTWPKLFDGDPEGLAVLRKLLEHPSSEVQDWARIGIERIETGNKWDRGPFKHGGLPDT